MSFASHHPAWLAQAPEAARTYLEGHRLDEVECITSDLPGVARGKVLVQGNRSLASARRLLKA